MSGGWTWTKGYDWHETGTPGRAGGGLRAGSPTRALLRLDGAPNSSGIANQIPVPDASLGTYRCTRCAISYSLPSGLPASCPLCDATARNHMLQGAINKESARAALLKEQLSRARADLDLQEAMRQAAALLDGGDLAFLKSLLYLWREGQQVQVRVTHGASPASEQARPNGFLLAPRTGEPQAHACTSPGGMALAAYMDQAARMWNTTKAVDLLMRVLALRLAITD